jgi:hypothetical protein
MTAIAEEKCLISQKEQVGRVSIYREDYKFWNLAGQGGRSQLNIMQQEVLFMAVRTQRKGHCERDQVGTASTFVDRKFK